MSNRALRPSFDPTEDPFNRFLLFAEGDDDAGGGGGDAGDSGGQGEGDGDSGDGAAGESEDKGAGAAGESEGADDWRALITDADAKKEAERTTDLNAGFKRISELRKELSSAITPLGKKPTDEQVAAYRKAIGVPETAELYTFAMPEGQEATDGDKAFQSAAAETFHGLNINAEQAEGLNKWWNGVQAAAVEQQIEDDKTYAAETEAALKAEWPGKEFKRNKSIADQAAAKVFGDAIDDVRKIETKDGRFILDHPIFVKMLAQVGREMQEGTIGNFMTDADRGGVESQIDELQGKIDKAKASGDRSLANELYKAQQDLYRTIDGSGPIVGAEGRAA